MRSTQQLWCELQILRVSLSRRVKRNVGSRSDSSRLRKDTAVEDGRTALKERCVNLESLHGYESSVLEEDDVSAVMSRASRNHIFCVQMKMPML